MKVEKKKFTEHPVGWFLFCLQEPEVIQSEWPANSGNFRDRLKWPCISTEKDEEGDNLIINIFTGVTVSDHKMDVHKLLVEDGFGINLKDYDDTDQISGRLFAGKVEKNAKSGKVGIVQFDTKDRIKTSAKKPTVDPFVEE